VNGPTPAERSLLAKAAVHTSWSRTTDRSARTAKARAAMDARFEREVDPEGVLPPEQRARRAASARSAFYAALAAKSAASRRVGG